MPNGRTIAIRCRSCDTGRIGIELPDGKFYCRTCGSEYVVHEVRALQLVATQHVNADDHPFKATLFPRSGPQLLKRNRLDMRISQSTRDDINWLIDTRQQTASDIIREAVRRMAAQERG